MKVDLTFFGIALKPRIDFYGFLDFISEKRAEVGLAVLIESEEERDYLKKRNSLAVPITIENVPRLNSVIHFNYFRRLRMKIYDRS